MIQAGDRVSVKLDDADWQPGVVIRREVTGHGTPARTVSYYVNVNGLAVTVGSSKIRATPNN